MDTHKTSTTYFAPVLRSLFSASASESIGVFSQQSLNFTATFD